MNKFEDPNMTACLTRPIVELIEVLKCRCRLCMAELKSVRVNMVSTEHKGVRLIEIANQLTSLNISDQRESDIAMDLCLSCAGKLVMVHEFREAWHKNEREFNTIFTAIQLKTRQFTSNQSFEEDDDMQVIYACRCCKEQFANNSEYMEHKKTHNNTLTSTPSKESNRITESSHLVFNIANLSEVVYSTNNNNDNMQQIKEEAANNQNTEFPCRHCSFVANSWAARTKHELEHKQQNKKLTVPPLILKKTIFGRRKLRKLRVLKAQDVMMPPPNVEDGDNEVVAVDPSNIQPPKLKYKCDKCSATFTTFKAKWWHDIKEHANKIPFIVGRGEKINKIKPKNQACRYCGDVFDNYATKYRHEKRCQAAVGVNDGNDANDERSLSDELEEAEIRVKCSKCDEEFTSRRARTVHEKRVHNLDIRECRVCHRMFSSYPGRYIHEKRCKQLRAQVEA